MCVAAVFFLVCKTSAKMKVWKRICFSVQLSSIYIWQTLYPDQLTFFIFFNLSNQLRVKGLAQGDRRQLTGAGVGTHELKNPKISNIDQYISLGDISV